MISLNSKNVWHHNYGSPLYSVVVKVILLSMYCPCQDNSVIDLLLLLMYFVNLLGCHSSVT